MQSHRRKVEQATREPNRLSQIDRNVSLALYKNVGMRIPRRVVMALEHTGSGVIWLPLVPILWYCSGNSAFRVVMANLFLGLWIDICYVGILKGIFRRKRPIYNHKGDFVVIVAVDQYSFPSGHAARVSFLAVFTWMFYSNNLPALAILTTVWALTVAGSRAAMGRHYVGDVLAGLLLGLVTTATLGKGGYDASHAWIVGSQSDRAHTWAAHQFASFWSRFK